MPLVDFFRNQVKESLTHADLVGEHITGLGGHPPIIPFNIKEPNRHDIKEILQETLDHEKKTISIYYSLLDQVSNKSIYPEAYARMMIQL